MIVTGSSTKTWCVLLALDPVSSVDKLGFYTVGDRKTYSKQEALEWQATTGVFPEWNFNRRSFDQYDWSREPQQDLWDLYKDRARQIRSRYDHVVIWYSGGSDSSNMLDAWIAADCKIDEIATWWNYPTSNDSNSKINSEIVNVVLPRIEQLRTAGLKFDFNLIDITSVEMNLINKQKDLDYVFTGVGGPYRMAIARFREEITKYKDMIVAGKKLCFLWGMDKPQLFYDGKQYLQFFDIILDANVNLIVKNNAHLGWYDELFYWSPDCLDLIAKQAHCVKRFLDSCDDLTFYQDKFAPFGFNPRIKKYLKGKHLRQLIYPTWNTETFTSGKNTNSLFTDRDSWLWNSNTEEKHRIKKFIIDKLSSTPVYWLNDPDDISKGIKSHASPRYYL